MFGLASLWQLSASGLEAAVWAGVWQWGLGVGLIILCMAGAYFSPINKRYFVGAAALIAIALFVYGRGQLTEHNICEAKIKYIYLKAHPFITKKNLAPRWRVSPTWQLGDKYRQSTTGRKATCDGPFDTACW
jgi:hypothetical protein